MEKLHRFIRRGGVIIAVLAVAALGVSHTLFSGPSPAHAQGNTYYVSTTGSDSNPGTLAQPFGTINKGVSVLTPGDTLYIRGGTYSNTSNYNNVIGYPNAPVPSGTDWNNPVTISRYQSETVVINGNDYGIAFATGTPSSYVIVNGITVTFGGAYFGTDSNHIRVQNSDISLDPATQDNNVLSGAGTFIEVLHSKIHGSRTGYGFYMNGHDNIFDGNEVYNNGGYGFHIFHQGGNTVSNNTVRNNYVHDNGLEHSFTSCGIILSSGSNNVAYNNIVTRQMVGWSGGCGIQVSYLGGGANNQMYNQYLRQN